MIKISQKPLCSFLLSNPGGFVPWWICRFEITRCVALKLVAHSPYGSSVWAWDWGRSKMIQRWSQVESKTFFFLEGRLQPPVAGPVFCCCWRFFWFQNYWASKKDAWKQHDNFGNVNPNKNTLLWMTNIHGSYPKLLISFIFEETIAGSIRNHLNSYASSPDFKRTSSENHWYFYLFIYLQLPDLT